jgi:hypothetical protein
MLRRTGWCIAAGTGWLAAQAAVVVGTGDPKVDISAVQSAVDQGGRIVLQGRFSFDAPPAATMAPSALGGPLATILVSKALAISGVRDDQSEMTVISGGTIPFEVEAPGSKVVIEGLRFINSKTAAINVYAATGLVIASNRIDGVMPGNPGPFAGISVSTISSPNRSQITNPENISGTIWIVNNDIDIRGTAGTNNLGILVFAAGKSPDSEAEIYVSGNTIRNTTEPAIEFLVIGGQAYAERNVITTGAAAASDAAAIRMVGPGSYLIADNSIDCGWTSGTATGINVLGNAADRISTGATIVNNDVNMSANADTVFGTTSAAIDIAGFAQGNMVLNNQVRGNARAALAVLANNGGTPANNKFIVNDLTGFQASLADVFVDASVTGTLIVGGHTSVEDHGQDTVIVPTP